MSVAYETNGIHATVFIDSYAAIGWQAFLIPNQLQAYPDIYYVQSFITIKKT